MKRRFEKSALLLVDIQNDFCPGGALAVNEGDRVVEVVNRLMPLFPYVIATQDWHPTNHASFKAQGGIWTPHCVQNTEGAELHAALNRDGIDDYFRKAFTAEMDAYSGFEGVNADGLALNEALRRRGVRTLYIAGLATDYCVKATALDGLKNSYGVFIVEDAIRAVDVNAGDGERALDELASQGARLITSDRLLDRTRAAKA